MPLTYQEFVDIRSKNPEEFNQKILPQMDLLEAVLRESVKTLSSAQPRDAARIRDFNAMADAIHTVCHPGSFTWESTKNAAMQKFATLRDFLENENGRNFDLLEATVQARPELLANLPARERSRPMLERYRDLSVYFGLNYSAAYRYRSNRAHRERFLVNRAKDPEGFASYTAKQMDYVGGVFRQLAQELEQEGGDTQEIRALRRMAQSLDVLKSYKDGAPPQELDEAMGELRELSALLEKDEGRLALQLHSAAASDPKLAELLPNSPAFRKMPVLQHLTEVLPILSLELTNGLQQLAAQENMMVTQEQEELARQQEEAARLADLRAEEEDAQDELHYQRMEELQRKNAEDRKKQEEDRRTAYLQSQSAHRNEHGPFSLPPQYDDLDAAAMLLQDAKQNGPQYQALVNFSQKLDADIRKWYEYFAPGQRYDQRLAAEMAKLPENASEELRAAAVEEALQAVSPAEQEEFLQERLGGSYQARLAAEQARLGPEATPEQARASLYREELTESLREPLRSSAYSQEQIDKSRADAALALAAEKRDAMDPAARENYEKRKAQIRNDVIARRIRNKLLEAGQDGNFRRSFLDDQLPTTVLREQYFLNHNREADLVNNYNRGVEAQELALYNSRVSELLNEALYDKAKWRELNQLFEKLGAPANAPEADPKALLDQLLNGARDGSLEEETEQETLEQLSKTIPTWEIERRARRNLGLAQNDQALLYGWAREQKQAQVRREVQQERRQAMPELADLGVGKAKAMRGELNRILAGCGSLLPTQAENQPLEFNYEQALQQADNVKENDRQQLLAAYRRHQAQQQNGGQPQAPQAPDPRMSEADKRAQRAQARQERHWQRVFRLDIIERRQTAEERRRQAIDDAKNQKLLQQYPVVGAALAELRTKLQGAKLTQGELGQAFQTLDQAWTQGDFQQGKALKEKLRLKAQPVEEQKKLLADEARELERNEPREVPGPQQNDENEIQRNYTEVEDDILFREEEQQPQQAFEFVQPAKYYVFQSEYVDKEQLQQEQLRQDLKQGLDPDQASENPPPAQRVILQGNLTHEKVKRAMGDISANPALKNANVDVIMPDRVPGPGSHSDEARIPPARNAARGDLHSASWWIKKLRSPENLYKRNPGTREKVLDITKLACVMAARELADSVRGEKARLESQNLSLAEIRNRVMELSQQPDFMGFLQKISSDPQLRRKAISAVGEGHGGGLDDLFTQYLARKGPGELPTSQDLKRWMPTALQRIEGLQEQLRAGNLDEFQTKKRVAEIIAARKLVEARRAGKFQHADQRLNRKLTDPQKLNDKAGDLVTCLTLLTSDQNESLARQAKEGHGGAMLESFKTMNSVKLHMQGINGGMAINPKYKLDAALAMAIYRESAQNAELQLDDTGAVHTAAVLRKLPFYKEFENRPETRDKLTQEVNIGSLYSDFVRMKDEHLEKENQRENVNELLEPEGPARGNTEQNILNWQ